MKKCPVCEKEVPVNTAVCTCSFRFLPEDENKPYCPSCNHNVKKEAEVCDECGYTFPIIIHPTDSILASVRTVADEFAKIHYIPLLRETYLKNKISMYEQMLAGKENSNNKQDHEETPCKNNTCSADSEYYRERYETTRDQLRKVQQELDILKDKFYNSGIEL